MSSKPAEQLWLPFKKKGELSRAETTAESPPEDERLMERVVDRDNLIRALRAWSADTVHQRSISTEPPWYVIRMPGGVGGGSREASPYPDYADGHIQSEGTLKFYDESSEL